MCAGGQSANAGLQDRCRAGGNDIQVRGAFDLIWAAAGIAVPSLAFFFISIIIIQLELV